MRGLSPYSFPMEVLGIRSLDFMLQMHVHPCHAQVVANEPGPLQQFCALHKFRKHKALASESPMLKRARPCRLSGRLAFQTWSMRARGFGAPGWEDTTTIGFQFFFCARDRAHKGLVVIEFGIRRSALRFSRGVAGVAQPPPCGCCFVMGCIGG